LWTQLANILSLATLAAPQAPQQPEDRGQKFPDSPDFSGSDLTQLRGLIAQLQILIQYKPTGFSNEQSMKRYPFHYPNGIALAQFLPQVQDNEEVGLEVQPASRQLLEAAFGDPNQVATAGWKMQEIKQ
jgi:hypothetical protein